MLSEQFRTLAMFSMLKDPIPATEAGLTMQLKSYKMNNLSLDDLPVVASNQPHHYTDDHHHYDHDGHCYIYHYTGWQNLAAFRRGQN